MLEKPAEKSTVQEEEHHHHHHEEKKFDMKDLRKTLGEACDIFKITLIIGFIAVMWVWTANDRSHEYAIIH